MHVDSAVPVPAAAPSLQPSASAEPVANDQGSFANVLLEGGTGWTRDLRRVGAGLALAAVFGLAIGARHGVASMAVHAAGVPLGLLAVAGLAAPALYVGVAHADLPVAGSALVGAVARGVATAGLVLAGLAPAALLLTVSTESHLSAAVLGAAGLAAGGGLGLRQLMEALRTPPDPQVDGDGIVIPARSGWLTSAFAVFATLLALRVWWLALPMLGRSALSGGL